MQVMLAESKPLTSFNHGRFHLLVDHSGIMKQNVDEQALLHVCAGRSQELYYVTPDGRELEHQETSAAPPILLDSLLGQQHTMPVSSDS